MPARAALIGVALAVLGCVEPDPSGSSTPQPIDVQGHRGARGLRPENTLPAFERAVALGVTTLELDLGMTRDGALVVTHDPRIAPAVCLDPGGTRIPEPSPLVRELRLEEIQAFDCGSLNPDPSRFPEPPRRNVPGARMPTLDEVFDLVVRLGAREVRFNIELKIVPGSEETPPLEPFVTALVEAVKRRGLLERSTLQSFDWRALAVARELEPRLRTAALLEPGTLEPRWLAGLSPNEHGDLAGLLRAARPFVDDVSPSWRMLLPRTGPGLPVAELQSEGFRVVPWTVNDRKTMERLLELGVDGIITDYPDRLLAVLAERNR